MCSMTLHDLHNRPGQTCADGQNITDPEADGPKLGLKNADNVYYVK